MKEDEPNLKTLRQSCANIKSMLILFSDRYGIVLHKFFRLTTEARWISGQCYLNIVKWLPARIAHVRPELFANNSWVLHHDCALTYVACCGRLVSEKWNDPDVTLCIRQV